MVLVLARYLHCQGFGMAFATVYLSRFLYNSCRSGLTCWAIRGIIGTVKDETNKGKQPTADSENRLCFNLIAIQAVIMQDARNGIINRKAFFPNRFGLSCIGGMMKIEISYRVRYTDQWFDMHESTVGVRSPADMYALVIDGKRTYKNESLDKVLTVQRRVVHTAKLLELSLIA